MKSFTPPKTFTSWLSLMALTALSACATSVPTAQDHSPTFGAAVAHNTAAQAIAPSPEQKADTYIPANRARRTLAKKRYEADEVKEPQASQTTQ